MRTIAETSLSERERALLECFVVELRERLGEELHGVWLYGSRARGEPPAHEDSDVDVIVLVDDVSREGQDRVWKALHDAGRRLGDNRTDIWFSVHIHDLEWLAGRRDIKSFYIAEVDRDKVVLVGGEYPSVSGSDQRGNPPMSARSDEFMVAAHGSLAAAEAVLATNTATALHAAYYAMFYAARAALSERDLYAKTHGGTWDLFYLTFVEHGDFDAALTTGARNTQPKREKADYEAWLPPETEALEAIDLAQGFVAAVDAHFA